VDIEELIKKIIDDGRIDNMHELSDILDETMEHLKHCDEDMYKKYEMKLYGMAYGNILNKQMAEKIVSNMRPYRMKWDMRETQRLQEEYGIDNIRDIDFFVVMNSAYNDYNDLFGDDVESYIKFTVDFIQDEDAKEDKVFIYFTEIPN